MLSIQVTWEVVPSGRDHFPITTYDTKLIWRNFLEAALECCAASLVDCDRDVVQHDRQQHVEAKGNAQAFPSIRLRRRVEGRYEGKVHRQQADDQARDTC